MASFLARRACRSLHRNLPIRLAQTTRSLHLTPSVQKKKSNVAFENDDLFSEEFVEEDLFTEAAVAPKTAVAEPAAVTPSQPLASNKSRKPKAKLTPEARASRFEAQLAYLQPRLGKRPEVKNPRIRKRSLITLAQLATSEEELKKVSELLPKYKAAGMDIPEGYAESFSRRCEELACPKLALDVFGNYAKFNLLLTLEAGQWLVHSLAIHEPRQLQVALALFNIYNLPPLAEDLTTAAIVAGVYSSLSKSPQLKEIVDELRQPISEMLKSTDISKASTNLAAKKHNWVAWSLHRANKSYVTKVGQPFVNPTLIPSGNKIALERVAAKP